MLENILMESMVVVRGVEVIKIATITMKSLKSRSCPSPIPIDADPFPTSIPVSIPQAFPYRLVNHKIIATQKY